MKAIRHATDYGIVLKKHRLADQHVALNIFSKSSGKVHLTAYGIRRITSRRLSHLETGNYITFSYRNSNGRFFLSETELIFGYSGIKADNDKLQKVYGVLQFLNKILPEGVPELEVFEDTLAFFKKLNNAKNVNKVSDEAYFMSALKKLGYLDAATENSAGFDMYSFIRQLAGLKLR